MIIVVNSCFIVVYYESVRCRSHSSSNIFACTSSVVLKTTYFWLLWSKFVQIPWSVITNVYIYSFCAISCRCPSVWKVTDRCPIGLDNFWPDMQKTSTNTRPVSQTSTWYRTDYLKQPFVVLNITSDLTRESFVVQRILLRYSYDVLLKGWLSPYIIGALTEPIEVNDVCFVRYCPISEKCPKPAMHLWLSHFWGHRPIIVISA